MSSLLDLLQIADASFPSGSYAHSLGLESLYGHGDLVLEPYLQFVLSNALARLELPVAREAFLSEDVAGLERLDALMDVLLPVREFRQASRSIGRSFLRAATRVRHVTPGSSGIEHHPVVFGAVLRAWGIDLDDGLRVYGWQSVRQQLSAAQRLGKIGQSEMQDLLDRLKPWIHMSVERSRTVELDEIGGFSPWLDLAGMAHEHQFSRLFLS